MQNRGVSDILEFISSEHCRVETPLNGAVISATDSARDPLAWPKEQENRIPLRETPGGVSVALILNDRNLRRSDEEFIWQALEEKYVRAASGDLSVRSDNGRLSKLAFETTLQDIMFANEKLSSINGIAVGYFEPLYLKERGPTKSVTAQMIIDSARVSDKETLEQSAAEALKHKKEDLERRAILESRDKLILPRYKKEIISLEHAKRKTLSATKAVEDYKQRLKRSRWWNIFSIPVLNPVIVNMMSRQKQKAENEELKERFQFMATLSELRSVPFLVKFNSVVNERLAFLGAPELASSLTPERAQKLNRSINNMIERVPSILPLSHAPDDSLRQHVRPRF